MALQAIKGGGMALPDHPLFVQRNLASGAFLLDASGEKLGMVFAVPRTGTIDRIVFRTGAVTTSQALRVGLQTVDAATGDPTGTAYGGMAAGTVASVASDTLYEVTLATGASATAGDQVAIVVEFDATAGNLNIVGANIEGGGAIAGLPYLTLFTTLWTKNTGRVPNATVRYSDALYEHLGGVLTGTVTAVTMSNASTPDERGNYFTVPGPCRAAGVWFFADIDESTSVILYDSDGTTALATVLLDKDIRAQNGLNLYRMRFAPVTLLKDTGYRLVFKPTTTTGIIFNEFTVLTAAMMDGNPGGTQWYKTSRTDAGAWTQDSSARVWGLGLLIDQIDDGVGGGSGGLLTHPGMGGGLRG